MQPPRAEACEVCRHPPAAERGTRDAPRRLRGRGSSVDTLSSDFPPSELWGSKCRFKPPRLWRFVTAALGSTRAASAPPFQAPSAPVLPRSDCLERQVRHGEGTVLQAEWRGARTQMLRPAGSAVSPADGQRTCGSEAGEGPPGGQACVTRCPGGGEAVPLQSCRCPAPGCSQAAGPSAATGAPGRLTPGPLGAGVQKPTLAGGLTARNPCGGRGGGWPADRGGLSVSITWE